MGFSLYSKQLFFFLTIFFSFRFANILFALYSCLVRAWDCSCLVIERKIKNKRDGSIKGGRRQNKWKGRTLLKMGLLAIIRYALETYLYCNINHKLLSWLMQSLPHVVYHCLLYSSHVDNKTVLFLFFIHMWKLYVRMKHGISNSFLRMQILFAFITRIMHWIS